jgi:hypothetical protein
MMMYSKEATTQLTYQKKASSTLVEEAKILLQRIPIIYITLF